MRSREHWRIAVDTGGTFTDCLARFVDEGGHERVRRVKILSTSALRGRVVSHRKSTLKIEAGWLNEVPSLVGFAFRALGPQAFHSDVARHEAGEPELVLRDVEAEIELNGLTFEVATHEPAPILAARIATRTPIHEPLPPVSLRLATTRGTNALLERAGARTALFINEGLGDLHLIGDQQRPDIFALDIRKPPPLHERVVEVSGRLRADGTELQPLDLDAVRREANRLAGHGITSAAIAFLHSYVNGEHERAVANVLREAGFTCITCSAELAPLIEILPRAETAVIEAYLGPIIEDYLQKVAAAASHEQSSTTTSGRQGAARSELHIMTSAGGLVRADQFRAKDSLLSGPAGGVAGAAAAGRASGFERIIGFDMGGTSTDVARFDGDFEYRFEHRVGSARLVAPALAIETVAAGGGSVCGYRDGRLFVGPESARADPGPACYGAGGPLTLTDVNLLMGRIDPELFEVPVDALHSEAALDDVIASVQAGGKSGETDRDALLDGFLAIANERMADSIRQVSLARGYDPADYALVSFGGAGGQHACAIASMLGIRTIIMPADASLLSAVGLDRAVVERFVQRQVLAPLEELGDQLAHVFEQCADEALKAVMSEGIERDAAEIRRRIANMRLLGQDATIAVEVERIEDLAGAFAQRYQHMYGYAPEGRTIEIESIRVVASSGRLDPGHVQGLPSMNLQRSDSAPPRKLKARFDGAWCEVPAPRHSDLALGVKVRGPAMILDRRSAYVIESGWTASIDDAGAIVVRQTEVATPKAEVGDDLVQLELYANRFASIAEEMGRILQRTALSTNVKRRLDFSCALLDANGELVVNAPHIPVHLGALGLCVRSVAQVIDMQPGDSIVTNHPACGGSHLPDVTVVTPVFASTGVEAGDDSPALLGYVANRAHHAEIGGTRPGSMPPMATRLAEEGVVIEPMHLVRGGKPNFDAVASLLRSGPFPTRAIEDNLADLRAAVAANSRGVRALQMLAQQHGSKVIAQQMDAIKRHAGSVARHALQLHGDGAYEATERLDDGSPICVKINLRNGAASIDFTGSAEQHPGNLNATPAIVQSAVLYVLRLLMGDAGRSAGLNEGILQQVNIELHRGMLNPAFDVAPADAPAVVGGNVETSQRVVDALLKALGLAACSQGTMNNVLFGNQKFGYYETVCGGSGATPTADGCDAVHTHMTNTRITDPELLEHRYPVRLERFAVRAGSGGAGRHRGGHGVVREIAFLAPMSLSLLTQHRVEQPYGLGGGKPGARGVQRVVRASGEELVLEPSDQCEVEAGDRLILETPGGGGWGAVDQP